LIKYFSRTLHVLSDENSLLSSIWRSILANFNLKKVFENSVTQISKICFQITYRTSKLEELHSRAILGSEKRHRKGVLSSDLYGQKSQWDLINGPKVRWYDTLIIFLDAFSLFLRCKTFLNSPKLVRNALLNLSSFMMLIFLIIFFENCWSSWKKIEKFRRIRSYFGNFFRKFPSIVNWTITLDVFFSFHQRSLLKTKKGSFKFEIFIIPESYLIFFWQNDGKFRM